MSNRKGIIATRVSHHREGRLFYMANCILDEVSALNQFDSALMGYSCQVVWYNKLIVSSSVPSLELESGFIR